MKYYFLYLFLFLLSGLHAQDKGSLSFNFQIEDHKKHQNANIDFLLIKNDSVYAREKFCMADHDWHIDSIAQGMYRLKVTCNDTAFFSYEQINVIAGKKNYYDFYISATRSKWRKETVNIDSTYSEDLKGEMTISVLYGDNSYDQPTYRYQNKMVSGEIAYNIYPLLTKYYTLGVKIGGQYARTEFINDTTHVNGQQILSRHYSYFDVNIGIINRFTFFNNQIADKDGLKLDIGLLYHLPVFFREIEKIDYDIRKNTKRIHTYTDFTAMARLGYKYVGVQAEYSLFNFLKRGYIENPQLRLGIVFFIPTAQ